jgi:hypothetical protein
METFKNNKLLWIVAAITLFNVGGLLVGNVLINKAADKVIERLQKGYSPSPYGPGLDPDKVNIDSARPKAAAFKTTYQEDPWRKSWELDRGFTAQ